MSMSMSGLIKTCTLPLATATAIDHCSFAFLLSNSIDTALMKAKAMKQNDTSLPSNMTIDEIAALNLYTESIILSSRLNPLLREKNFDSSKSLFPYLKLLMFALSKLPRRPLHSNLFDEETDIEWIIKSGTEDLSIESKFRSKGQAIFTIDAITAIDISAFSSYQSEKRTFITAGSIITVKRKLNEGELKIIRIEETENPLLSDDVDQYLRRMPIESKSCSLSSSSSLLVSPPFSLLSLLSIHNDNKPANQIWKISGNKGKKESFQCRQLCINEASKQLILPDREPDKCIQVFNNYGREKNNPAFSIGNTTLGSLLECPQGVTAYKNEIFVSDRNHHILVFDANNGALLRKWGKQGKGKDELKFPKYLSVDGNNNELYVADSMNKRVQVYSLSGEYRRSIHHDGNPYGIAIWGYCCYVTHFEKGFSYVSVYHKITGKLIKTRKLDDDKAGCNIDVKDGAIFIAALEEVLVYDADPSSLKFIRSIAIPDLSNGDSLDRPSIPSVNEELNGVFYYRSPSSFFSCLYISTFSDHASFVRLLQL